MSDLIVELRALIVMQDGGVGAAREERVARFAVDALKRAKRTRLMSGE